MNSKVTNLLSAIERRDAGALQQLAPKQQPQRAVPKQAVQIFNELFVQLKAAFPAAWTNLKTQEDLNELRRQWVLSFTENGITTMEQVNAGMRIARRQEVPYLPSPGQFVAWCKQGAASMYGLLDEDELCALVMKFSARRYEYRTAEEFPWPSPAAYWMTTALYDGMRSGNWTESELHKAARKELQSMAKRLEAGEEIPEPVARLPELKITNALKGRAGLQKIAEIRARFGLRGGAHG